MRYILAKIRIKAVAVFLSVFAAWPVAAQERIAITPVTVIDVINGKLLTDQTVLVDGNRISAVKPKDALAIPQASTVIDGSGKYLIPGLWDMHVHATREDRLQSFFRLFLANGITGFRDMFGSSAVGDKAKASMKVGDLPGPPRFVVAGHLIDGPRSLVPGALKAATPEEGKRIVDSLHSAGAPFIKVYHSLPPETYFTIAELAREHGLTFVGHIPFLVRASEASDAGHHSIEHLTGVIRGCSADEEGVLSAWRKVFELGRVEGMQALIQNYMTPARHALETQDEQVCRRLAELFIKNETWLVPTLVSLRGKAYLRERAAESDSLTNYFRPPSRWTSGRPFGFPMSKEQWEVLQKEYSRQKEIVGVMAAEDAPILAGSDTATPWAFPGFGLHEELNLLVEAGLTPLQALKAATLNPARFFGRTDELGTIEQGKLADLVLLEANPLEDITNTKRIRAVIADGRLYRRSDLDRLLDEVEETVQAAKDQE